VAYRGKKITSPRLRGLLALLAGDLRTGCSTARLVDGLAAGTAMYPRRSTLDTQRKCGKPEIVRSVRNAKK
jgi:hypothetical protein